MSTESRRCRGCGRGVVAGISSSGIDVQVDDIELDPDLELEATLAGVATFTHHLGADELAYRGPRHIRESPAGTRPRTAVRPEHRCDRSKTP